MALGGAYRSSTDLITETLAILGVLAAGQSPDPEDWNYVAEKLDSVIRELVGLEICYVADQNNIPGAWFASLADILAGRCATKFGSDEATNQRLVTNGLGIPPGSGAAAMALKAMTRGRYTGEVLRTEYL